MKFSATIVTYRPDIAVLERSIASLALAVARARDVGLVSDAVLYIVDNGPAEALGPIAEAAKSFAATGTLEILHGHGNVGYGRANNLVLPRLDSDAHLVMNPDVELDRDTLVAAIEELQVDTRIGAVAPAVRGPLGERQYLCKRYPSVWVLFLRGFAPGFMRRWFSALLDRYEMRDLADDRVAVPVPLASGCFMLMRTPIFRRVGGFDPRFFMYFEDYDLSLRIGRHAQVAYVPQARIVHYGGEASRKGFRHVGWFVRSAWQFFATHGWKIA
ncbi:MAG TPA: glycosyltransferase family 2 protein [Usitatibacter sp.]|nr:glycosyltransferase family 2 protein [Usitatibacter sp.]